MYLVGLVIVYVLITTATAIVGVHRETHGKTELKAHHVAKRRIPATLSRVIAKTEIEGHRSCADDATFVDSNGRQCGTWQAPCAHATGYSDAEMQVVRSTCAAASTSFLDYLTCFPALYTPRAPCGILYPNNHPNNHP